MSENKQTESRRFMLVAAALTMAVALSVLGRGGTSQMQASANSGATSAAMGQRDPASVEPPASQAFPSRAVDVAGTRSLLLGVSAEDLLNARENANPDERELLIADLVARLVEIDSGAAARFAEHISEPRLREVSLRVVAQRWARVDAVKASAWAAALGDTKERDQAILNVALELVQIDPPQAVRLLERQFAADIPAGILEGVLQQWAEKNYEGALAWSETLPLGARRDLVLQRLVFVRANQNPMDAARLAEEAFVDSDMRIEALASIALNWGSRDPESARGWARTLAGRSRERVDAELALLGAADE